MDKGEKKDFKSVKVNIKGTKTDKRISRSMLYSGINIFGQLSEMYINKKRDEVEQAEDAGQAQADDVLALPSEVLMIFKRV